MNFTVNNCLAVYWMLTCLVSLISGSPQAPPYWVSRQIGIGINYSGIDKKSSIQFDRDDKYRSSSDSSYESIDQFQIEQQQRQQQNQPNLPQHDSHYRGDDNYFNQFRNDQESYYQTLLRVTESPLKEIENQATYVSPQERQIYYQDYLPLDEDEEIIKVEDFNINKESAVKNSSVTSEVEKENVKNSTEEKFAALVTELLMKEPNYVPSLNDLNTLNSLEDEMISEASFPEEIKRRARQVRGQQPGLLWTVARLAFEKVNDTKSATKQIGTIINNSLSPELALIPIVTTTTTVSSALNDVNATLSDVSDANVESNSTTTTTEAPFRLTRTELQGIIRRNLRGLIRLFRIEWQDALNQSQVAVRDFNRDLKNQIRPYLEPNPNVN